MCEKDGSFIRTIPRNLSIFTLKWLQVDGYSHFVIMLYAALMHFDSLPEIVVGMLSEAHKLRHLGISYMVKRSTLSQANNRRKSEFFEKIYFSLYEKYKNDLADSSADKAWESMLHIMDSTTITLFSNVLKGVGRSPKHGKKKGDITHTSRRIEYWQEKKKHSAVLLTNNFDLEPEEIIDIYLRRWQIESLNAIKTQIWITLIANLLLSVIKKRIKREWNFSNLVTMVRQTLMYYIDLYRFCENPEKAWREIINQSNSSPPEPSLFERGLTF